MNKSFKKFRSRLLTASIIFTAGIMTYSWAYGAGNEFEDIVVMENKPAAEEKPEDVILQDKVNPSEDIEKISVKSTFYRKKNAIKLEWDKGESEISSYRIYKSASDKELKEANKEDITEVDGKKFILIEETNKNSYEFENIDKLPAPKVNFPKKYSDEIELRIEKEEIVPSTYYIEGIDKEGVVGQLSEEITTGLSGKIAGYSYKVNTKDEYDPDNKVEVEKTKITVKPRKNKAYLHIRAVDENGVAGEVATYELPIKKDTVSSKTSKIPQVRDGVKSEISPSKWTNEDVEISVNATSIKGYKKIKYPDGSAEDLTVSQLHMYGGPGEDAYRSVYATKDGGFIAVGDTTSSKFEEKDLQINGSTDAILVKYDEGGNVQWVKNWGRSGYDAFHGVVEVIQNNKSVGYVAVGESRLNGVSSCVTVRFDENGNKVWEDFTAGVRIDNVLWNVIQDSAGRIVAAGWIDSNLGDDRDGLIKVYNPDNKNPIKMVTSPYDNPASKQWFYEGYDAIAEVRDGYIVVGACTEWNDTKGGYEPNKATIVKFDKNFNVMWRRYFNGKVAEGKSMDFDNLIVTKDGNVVVLGDGNADAGEDVKEESKGGLDGFIVKFDVTDGSIIWSNRFGGSGNEQMYNVKERENGDIVVVGTTSSADGDMAGTVKDDMAGEDAFIMTFSGITGEKVGVVNRIGGSGSDVGWWTDTLNDGRLVTVGSTTSKGSVGNDAFVTFSKGTTDVNTKYKVSENGTYKFEFTDVSNKVDEHIVKVDNIDKEKPVISLRSNLDKANAEIDVQVTDNVGIEQKKWAQGKRELSYIRSNGTEFVDDKIDAIENETYTVYARDLAGNESISTIVVNSKANSSIILKATPDTSKNAVNLNWGVNPDNKNLLFKVFNKKVGEAEFQPISGIDFSRDFDKKDLIDKSAKDDVSPTAPKITSQQVKKRRIFKTSDVSFNINISSTDEGAVYEHYVEGVDKSDYSNKIVSNITSTEIKSGIKGYSYVIDNSSATVPDSTVDTVDGDITINVNPNDRLYIHVRAIDNAGNESKVSHAMIQKGVAPVITLSTTAQHRDNYINLDWKVTPDTNSYMYKAYARKDGETDFRPLPAGGLAKKKVNVLNLYPRKGLSDNGTIYELPMDTEFTTYDGESMTLPMSAKLKRWMEEPNAENPKGYGKGQIEVTPMDIIDFNNNPEQYLKNGDGSWKYDVIMIGSYDNNAHQDLTSDAVKIIRQFVDDGRGILIGHDTISSTPNIGNEFSSYANIKKFPLDQLRGVGDTEIRVKKKGLLTSYPWYVGGIGSTLTIPRSHTTAQAAVKNDIWMEFVDITDGKAVHEGVDVSWPEELYETETHSNNFYLSTFENTAVIQTGHSNGGATPDEQKLLANTLFYLNQLSEAKSAEDRGAMDFGAPTKPGIKSNVIKKFNLFRGFERVISIQLNSEDTGTVYEHYVEGIPKENYEEVIESNMTSTEIKSGLKGYSYVIDTSKTTEPDNNVNTSGSMLNIRINPGEIKYLHVKAIDNVGNSSETVHYEIKLPGLLTDFEIFNGEVSHTDGTNVQKVMKNGKYKFSFDVRNIAGTAFLRTFGGSGSDHVYRTILDRGSYVSVGYTTSGDGDFSGMSKGKEDAFIVKYDNIGNIVWKKTFGGSSWDYFTSLIKVDGGYVVAGYTHSRDGDLSGLSITAGSEIIIVKYDFDGNLIWKKNAKLKDNWAGAHDLVQTQDGGYIVVGNTSETGGKGDSDAYFVKFDRNGEKEFQNKMGGNKEELYDKICANGDGTYTLVGSTMSSDFEGLSSKGSKDAILVKINDRGDVLMKSIFGGSGEDLFRSVIPAKEGGYYICGYTESNNGDLTGVKSNTARDALVIKMRENGSIEWMRTFGGSGSEWLLAQYETEDGVILSGFGTSNDGDLAGMNNGAEDAIILKYLKDGTLDWKRSFGGEGSERLRSMVKTPEGGYLIAGDTNSKTGVFQGMNKGGPDALLVKLNSDGSLGLMPNDDEISEISYKIESNKSGLRKVIKQGTFTSEKVLPSEQISKVIDFTAPNEQVDELILTAMLTDGQDSDKSNNKIVLTVPMFEVLSTDYALSNDKITNASNVDQNELEIGKEYSYQFDVSNLDNKPFIKTFGGTGDEHFEKHRVTRDGGVVAVGRTTSSDGDIGSTNKGGTDALLVKYDQFGEIEWKKNFGGSKDDFFYNVVQTKDDGFVAVGVTASNDCDLAGYNVKDNDSIIVKYDKEGKELWKNVFINKGILERIFQIEEGLDGNLYMVNEKHLLNNTSNDTVIEKRDSKGNLIWERRLASSSFDNGYGLSLASNGDVLVAGRFVYSDYDFAGKTYRGSNDAYVARLDGSNGSIKWISTWGGTENDDARRVVEADNGELIVIGGTASNDYTFSSMAKGGVDSYIAKLSSSGVLLSMRVYGGSGDDVFNHLAKTYDGGYIISGSTTSSNGDYAGHTPKGSDAFWIKLDKNLDEVWKGYIYGSRDEITQSAIPLPNGSVVVVGETRSNDGDFKGLLKGGLDAFVARLNPEGRLESLPISERISTIKYSISWSDGNRVYPVEIGSFDNEEVLSGTRKQKTVKFAVPRDSSVKTIIASAELIDNNDINSFNNRIEKTVNVLIPRDYYFAGYNVKEEGKNDMVGTLRKNKNYEFNVKLANKYIGTVNSRNRFFKGLKSNRADNMYKIDNFNYKIVATNGINSQNVNEITIDNVRGQVLAQGNIKDIEVPDKSSAWQGVKFKTPDDEKISEIIFVVEINSVDDADLTNNRLVVKLPILNKEEEDINITGVEIYPSGMTSNEQLLIGDEVSIKVVLGGNALRTRDIETRLIVEDGGQKEILTKNAYGVSMEYPGVVYFKYKPKSVGNIKVTAEIDSVGGKKQSSPVTAKVSRSESPSVYEKEAIKKFDKYNISSDLVTYVKMNKRDKGVVMVRYCSSNDSCQEDFNGTRKCPGHEYYGWGDWYEAYIPMKSTKLTDFEEWYDIKKILFKSKYTEKVKEDGKNNTDENGYVDLLSEDQKKYAAVKAGYGFEFKIETEYKNNVPKLFEKAYTPNLTPSNTSWSEYRVIPYDGAKIPFIYYPKNSSSIDEEIKMTKGAMSFTVPSMTDLVFGNPDQLYIKMPDGKYMLVDEGYGANYGENVKPSVEVTSSPGFRVQEDMYYDAKVLELKKGEEGSVNKRQYYLGREVRDGDYDVFAFNRYSGYGSVNTRLHDKKVGVIKVRGSKYDDIKDSI